MKTTLVIRLLLCYLIWAGVTDSFAQEFKPKYLRENDRSFLQLTSLATDDGWIEFRAGGDAVEAASFSTKFATSLGLKDGYQLRLVKDKTDPKETRHQHYQLYWKDVLVEGGHLSLHSRKGRLKEAHTRIIEELAIDTDKRIDEHIALLTALADRKLRTDDLEDSQKRPKSALVLTRLNGNYVKENYRLAYYFDLYTKNFQDANRVYVDAVTGAVLKHVPLTSKCFNPQHASHTSAGTVDPLPVDKLSVGKTNLKPLQVATFNSIHPRSNPTPTFDVESAPTGGYRLTMSTNVGQALRTRRDLNNDGALNDSDLANPTTAWGNTEQHATLAHWVTYRSYQYFLNRFGVNGTDGQGAIGDVFIDPVFNGGASWTYATRTMKIGQAGGNILSTVDIVGHEYGHGVTNHLVAGWLYGDGQNIALSEGFSDIIGTAMERELLPDGAPNDRWNYRLGEDAFYARNMANPTEFGHPWTYQQSGSWDFSNNDVHRNAGVLDKWFHTLTTGNGPNNNYVAPISFDDAMSVVYWGLDNYIYGDYNYPNAANALRAAAAALFGECSPQHRAVIGAWRAANIFVNSCSLDCDYYLTNTSPQVVNCNQTITLSAACSGAATSSCPGTNFSFSGPNLGYNLGGPSINVTAPSSAGNYQYSVNMSKAGCYARTETFSIQVNCGSTPACDFSSGPRYVGTWYGLTVQIRSISGKNVLVTAITGSPDDKYYPRGDNFWGSFNLDPNAAGLQSCLNAGSSGYGGLSIPGGLTPPPGYSQGTESDGAVYFHQSGTPPTTNPCDFSTPRQVGTWNGLNVQIRQFANNKRTLVTHIPGSSNDKYYPRGDNFWDNFTKNSDADQYRSCLNTGDTGWYGLSFPGGISPPSGYIQGSEQDGAVFFSTNGLRVAAPDATLEEVSLVRVHPNPAQYEVTVTFLLKEAGSVQVRLLDLQGRVRQQQLYKGVAGQNERVLNVASLSTGIYALEVNFEGQRVIHKLVKE